MIVSHARRIAGALLCLFSASTVQAIVGGTSIIERTDRPLPAAAFVGIGVQGARPHCSGIVIAPHTVLTAAHCLYQPAMTDGAPEVLRETETLRVSNELDDDGAATSWLEVIAARPLPSYRGHLMGKSRRVFEASVNDLAILHLRPEDARSVTIPLASQGIQSGEQVLIGGFGYQSFDSQFQEMMPTYGERKFLRLEVGQDFTLLKPVVAIHDKFLVEHRADESICHGDSGGGAIIERPDGDYVVGIASHLFTWMSGYGCEARGSAFTNLIEHRDWILSEMSPEDR